MTIELKTALWFHGCISRWDAEQLLREDSEFLVRESITEPGSFVLTSRWAGNEMHFKINYTPPEGKIPGGYHFEDIKFATVPRLVEYYVIRSKPVTASSGAVIRRGIRRVRVVEENEQFNKTSTYGGEFVLAKPEVQKARRLSRTGSEPRLDADSESSDPNNVVRKSRISGLGGLGVAGTAPVAPTIAKYAGGSEEKKNAPPKPSRVPTIKREEKPRVICRVKRDQDEDDDYEDVDRRDGPSEPKPAVSKLTDPEPTAPKPRGPGAITRKLTRGGVAIKPAEPDATASKPVGPGPITPKPAGSGIFASKPAEPPPVVPKPAEPAPLASKPLTTSLIIPKPVEPVPRASNPVTSSVVVPKPTEPAPLASKPLTSSLIAPKPTGPAPLTPKPITSSLIAPKPTGSAPLASKPITSSLIAPKSARSDPIAAKPDVTKLTTTQPGATKNEQSLSPLLRWDNFSSELLESEEGLAARNFKNMLAALAKADSEQLAIGLTLRDVRLMRFCNSSGPISSSFEMLMLPFGTLLRAEITLRYER